MGNHREKKKVVALLRGVWGGEIWTAQPRRGWTEVESDKPVFSLWGCNRFVCSPTDLPVRLLVAASFSSSGRCHDDTIHTYSNEHQTNFAETNRCGEGAPRKEAQLRIQIYIIVAELRSYIPVRRFLAARVDAVTPSALPGEARLLLLRVGVASPNVPS